MAGFWDQFKSIFGMSEPAKPTSPWTEPCLSAITRQIAARQSFQPFVIARELGGTRTMSITEVVDICAVVRQICTPEWLSKHGYELHAGEYRPLQPAPRPGPTPTTSSKAPASSARIPSHPAPKPASSAPPPKDPPRVDNTYEAKEILGLSEEELRRRALKINPYNTAWIGRVDTIPPQSDERTALIDRGLLIRGLLTLDELREIHRIGDLWIKHRLKDDAARAFASKTAQEAIDKLRAEKAAKKEEKQRVSKEKAEQKTSAIAQRKLNEIIYLGRGVSSKLNDVRANIEALDRAKLPVLASPADVAKALGITIPRLRWLCFHAEATENPHYVYFEVPKRSGGKRLLSAPMPELAKAQRWVFENILAKLPIGPQAHGFVTGRSTLSNAKPHVGQDVVVNLDLSDFFPTITFPRVRGLFEKLGYSPAAATILALTCTESPRRAADFEGKRYWVAIGPRGLPQGACTSPALSNQIGRKLDRRLTGMAGGLGWQYTRYADDLTFSAPEGKRPEIGKLIAKVRHIAQDEGFALNPKKGRVQRAGGRQTVTGIVVNEKPALPREEVRRLRAILHGARKTGLPAQNRQGLPHFESWLRGKLAYLSMIDPDKGFPMLRELDELQRPAKVA